MYLWSNPDLPHWQRLLLGIIYLPMLFWWWLVGNPIQLSRRTQDALDGVPPQEAGDLTPADIHAKMARLAKPRRQ